MVVVAVMQLAQHRLQLAVSCTVHTRAFERVMLSGVVVVVVIIMVP